MSFWWLNPLMKRGKEKPLEDDDIPKLHKADRAESCYLMFTDLLDKQKKADPLSQPSVLKTILLCHWRQIFVSGFFALLKIITLSAGPLLLNAFIKVAEGNASFKYEGYVLAALHFCSKNLESLSQRQWYFRSRLIGLNIRSLLTVAIYKKQLRLSNAAKLIHSSGEIINYVWWMLTGLENFPSGSTIHGQQSFSSALSSLSSIVRLGLPPLHPWWFQSKLMLSQDERLKAVSEALASMKVLKLYAWERHFKNVVENLRHVEEKWLQAVQLRRAYNSFLFWSSPVLVSWATFGACCFLGVPLSASNVFTFVATLRLVQDLLRTIPDVIGVVIQAKVSFNILKFLQAPELDVESVRQKRHRETATPKIIIKSAYLSWEENQPKPTLENINLEVYRGEKVAICGEVGSGKSTLLAAVLGEVPITHGTVLVQGTIAYVAQSAWIQTGSIQENILFGSPMDYQRRKRS